MRNTRIRAALARISRTALLVTAVLAMTACVTGKPAPEPTPEATFAGGTFVFGTGDYALCSSKKDMDNGNAVTCDNLNESDRTLSLTVHPPIEVTLEPFAIDIHEVTNQQYEYCMETGPCDLPEYTNIGLVEYFTDSRYDDFPVVSVTWEQAQEYCEFMGKRLPTEYEWERVAGGPAGSPEEKRLYPIQEAPTLDNPCGGGGLPVDFCGGSNFPQPALVDTTKDYVEENGQRVYGMAGNVEEWVADWFKLQATCETTLSDIGCSSCFQTDGTVSMALGCNDCEACREDDDCYTACPGTGNLQYGYPVCIAYSEARSCGVTADGESTCGPTEDEIRSDRCVRGGSYSTDVDETCQLRSDYRSRKFKPSEGRPTLGFRCARSLSADEI